MARANLAVPQRVSILQVLYPLALYSTFRALESLCLLVLLQSLSWSSMVARWWTPKLLLTNPFCVRQSGPPPWLFCMAGSHQQHCHRKGPSQILKCHQNIIHHGSFMRDSCAVWLQFGYSQKHVCCMDTSQKLQLDRMSRDVILNLSKCDLNWRLSAKEFIPACDFSTGWSCG